MPLLTVRPKENCWNIQDPNSPASISATLSTPHLRSDRVGIMPQAEPQANGPSTLKLPNIPILSLPETPSPTTPTDPSSFTFGSENAPSSLLPAPKGLETPRPPTTRNLSVILDCSPPVASAPPGSIFADGSRFQSARRPMQRARHVSDSQLAMRAREQASDLTARSPSSDLKRDDQFKPNPSASSNFLSTDKYTGPSMRRRSSQLLDKIASAFEPDSDSRRAALLPPDSKPSLITRWRSSKMFVSISRSSVGQKDDDKLEKTPPHSRHSKDCPNIEEDQNQNNDRASTSTPPPTNASVFSLRSRNQQTSRPMSGSVSPAAPSISTSTVSAKGTPRWLSWRSKRTMSRFPAVNQGPVPCLTAPSTPRESLSAASHLDETSSTRLSADRFNSSNRLSLSGSHHGRMHSIDRNSSPLARSSIGFVPGQIPRNNTMQSNQSGTSSPTLAPPPQFRQRSSTFGSNGQASDDGALSATPPQAPGLASARTSLSTNTGRSSFSNLFSLGRLRHGSEPHSPFPALNASHPPDTATQASGSSVSLPARLEDESVPQYLSRIEGRIQFAFIASVVSKYDDEFHRRLLRSFMNKFLFFGEPIDMAIRKFLLHVELPKESQQIDRLLQSFSDRYHECNPGIFPSSDAAYFITFSILILQTDAFNKNNKSKMTRPAYIKNASGEGVPAAVLSCIYDNIVYTPFIRVEDEQEIATITSRSRKKRGRPSVGPVPMPSTPGVRNVASSVPAVPPTTSRPVRRALKEPLDPYMLIFEARLGVLRPSLKDILTMEDPYVHVNANLVSDKKKSHFRQRRPGVLQIESARSRPNAFTSPMTIEKPEEARVGLVDIPVEKVGVLWRKSQKRKTARSPWQEWGAMLTGQGLCLFRNVSWVKTLISQHNSESKQHPNSSSPVVYEPAIADFKPDDLLSTLDSVSLIDTEYKRHKNAFIFVRGPFEEEEAFLADSETDLNDWLQLLNRHATFKTAGMQPQGPLYSHSGDMRARLMQVEAKVKGTTDPKLSYDISLLRQVTMEQKIKEWEDAYTDAIKELDEKLRDARHISIMSPIQPKSREQLVQAASRLGESIKRQRFATRRLKCHRDSLAKELDEERMLSKELSKLLDRSELVPPAESTQSLPIIAPEEPVVAEEQPAPVPVVNDTVETASIASDLGVEMTEIPPPAIEPIISPPHTPLESQSTNTAQESQQVRHSISLSSAAPSLRPRSSDFETGTDDIFYTPLNMSPNPQPETARPASSDTLQLPPSVDQKPTRRSSNASESASYMSATSGVADALEQPCPGSPPRHQRNSAVISDPTNRNSLTSKGSQNSTHSHRSISRTFKHPREGALKWKTRSKEIHGVESTPTDQESEGLARTQGSFTLHGKKASVITFGSEWQGMSAEERLKARKQLQSDPSTEEALSSPEHLAPPTDAEALHDRYVKDTENSLPLPNLRPLSLLTSKVEERHTYGNISLSSSAPEIPRVAQN